jgi:hypothetical protein
VVLQDCLRWLALRGLTAQRLFAGPAAGDKRKLLALRHLYDTGRRPLRSKSCRDKEPQLVASLLLLWLGSLPEPLFPAALVPELVDSQQSDYYEERLASVRGLLKRADPYVVEALFPLFELLHHYWINQVCSVAFVTRAVSLAQIHQLLHHYWINQVRPVAFVTRAVILARIHQLLHHYWVNQVRPVAYLSHGSCFAVAVGCWHGGTGCNAAAAAFGRTGGRTVPSPPQKPLSHRRRLLLLCSQADRDSSLQDLGRLLTPAVFGTARQHGLPPADGGLLSDTVEMLISEYRPLFTQPFNLRRYEADAARQAAAEAARTDAAGMPSSPLLTPIRCERLSVMVPEGLGSPFGDCCATPLAPESPVSAFLAAAALEQAASASASPSPRQAATPQAQPAFTSVAVVPLVGAAPARSGLSALQTPPPLQPHSPMGHHHHAEADAHLEETFSSLLESTVSGMLFGGDLLAAEAAPAPAPGGPIGMELAAGCHPMGGSSVAGDADMQPMSPVAVLPEPASDGGDTSDGSDCDALPAGKSPFAWQRASTAGLALC